MVSKSDLYPEETSLTISLRNRLGMPWKKKTKVILKRIGDYLLHDPKVREKETEGEGRIVFDEILEGEYLVKCVTKGAEIDEIIETDSDDVNIKIPLFFGWLPLISDRFKKRETLSKETILEHYQEVRTDRKFCFFCKKEYEDWRKKYKCSYCEKFFCSEHKLPENHNCWGEPQMPPGGMRVLIDSNGKIRVLRK